jgi:hypothetical protein
MLASGPDGQPAASAGRSCTAGVASGIPRLARVKATAAAVKGLVSDSIRY